MTKLRGQSGRLIALLTGVLLIWLLFVISSYYVAHKPFSPAGPDVGQAAPSSLGIEVAAIGRTFLDLAAALWLVIIAYGPGLWLWRRLAPRQHRSSEALVFGLGIGFGVLGLLVLFLGLAGLLSPPFFYGLGLACSLAAVRPLARQVGGMKWKVPSRPVALYLALTLSLALALALLPPTNWDGLFYHLKGPKLYLQAGQIRPGIDIPHLNFPSLFEMLFLFAMAIRGDITAQLVHFIFLFPLAGVAYLTARRILRVDNGWPAVIFLLATPMVLLLAAWTYNDLALAFFSTAALYFFMRWQPARDQRWLLLSGLFSGLAMSLKYISFVTPLFLGCLLLWQFRRNLREGARLLLLFALPTLLVASPWFLKNWWFTGNPVYPFLFGGRFWDAFRTASYGDPGSGIGLDLVAILRLPYDLTLGIADASQDGPTGPLYLAFLPLMLLYAHSHHGRHAPPAFRTILLYALANYAFWVLGVISSAGLRQTRLLLPAFAALCPALAWVLQDLARFDRPQFSLQRFLNLVIAFVLFLGMVDQLAGWAQARPWQYLLGVESRDRFLTRRLGAHYAAMQAINETLPEDAVVVFLWEPRSYYCDRDCRPDSILDAFDHLVYLYQDAPGIAEAWRAAGITHVLIWRTGLEFVLQKESPTAEPLPEPAVLRRLRADYLVPTWNIGDAYELLALRDGG